jgi:hypothetical protein
LSEVSDCIKHQSTLIQTRQIQTIINKYFYKSLQKKLNSNANLGPIIDPTVGMYSVDILTISLNNTNKNIF